MQASDIVGFTGALVLFAAFLYFAYLYIYCANIYIFIELKVIYRNLLYFCELKSANERRY